MIIYTKTQPEDSALCVLTKHREDGNENELALLDDDQYHIGDGNSPQQSGLILQHTTTPSESCTFLYMYPPKAAAAAAAAAGHYYYYYYYSLKIK